jgi:hypothetical protein
VSRDRRAPCKRPRSAACLVTGSLRHSVTPRAPSHAATPRRATRLHATRLHPRPPPPAQGQASPPPLAAAGVKRRRRSICSRAAAAEEAAGPGGPETTRMGEGATRICARTACTSCRVSHLVSGGRRGGDSDVRAGVTRTCAREWLG